MTLELIEPIDAELEDIIKRFLGSLVKTKVVFDEMRQVAEDKGITDQTLIDLLRYYAQQMRVPRSTLFYWLKPLRAKPESNIGLIDYNILPEDIVLINDDFRNVQIPKSSVSLIFTDPPYDLQSLDVYRDLAKMADDILIEGGSLITYAGQYALPTIFDHILRNSELRYWWMICVKHTGRSSQMFQKDVIVQWKPLLWFVKGKNLRQDLPGLVEDFIESEPPDKDFHEWAQSTKEAEQIISKLTHSSEIVVDPFMGSATTAIAALEQKRRFTGIEIDADKFALAKARLSGYANTRSE